MMPSTSTTRSNRHSASRPGAPRGFTLIEIMVAVTIVILVSAMAIVAVNSFVRTGRRSAEESNLRALSMALDQFKQSNKFYVPLVNDFSSLAGGPIRQRGPTEFTVRIAGQLEGSSDDPLPPLQFLSYESGNPTDPRYSELSLSYYLLGALGKEVDGIDGPGMTTPYETPRTLPWRSFMMQGRRIDPFYDASTDKSRVRAQDATGNPVTGAGSERQTRIVDRWGGAIRYYRWEPLFHVAVNPTTGRPTTPPNQVTQVGEVRDYCQPEMLGDPRANASLRSMKWAVVSKGPDGQINESNRSDPVNLDNIIMGEGGVIIEGGGS